jgi:ribosomal protein L12E/L44/L45/RPP1/RPP2
MAEAENERLKYLFKSVLGVDVDAIVRQVVAKVAVERAHQVRENSEEWERYMQAEGGVVFLPRAVHRIGKP